MAILGKDYRLCNPCANGNHKDHNPAITCQCDLDAEVVQCLSVDAAAGELLLLRPPIPLDLPKTKQ